MGWSKSFFTSGVVKSGLITAFIIALLLLLGTVTATTVALGRTGYGYGGSGWGPFGGGGWVDTRDRAAPAISGVAATGIDATAATICWSTDEPADSQVEYGASPTSMSPLVPELVTSHSITLSDLLPETTYTYNVRSCDESGNLAVSDDYTFNTLPQATDTSAPVISTVTIAAITEDSVTITWTTDDPADSQVLYWVDAGSSLSADATLVTSHSVTLVDLLAGTTYSFQALSTDASGNMASSDTYSFTTMPVPTNWPLLGGVIGASALGAAGVLAWYLWSRRSTVVVEERVETYEE